jgi:hypothetical protein
MAATNGAGPDSAVTEIEARTVCGTGERHKRFKPPPQKTQAGAIEAAGAAP